MFPAWQIESEIFVYNCDAPVVEEKNPFHTLCKLPLGHDKSWSHHWLQLQLCGRCKQWQIPSFHITRVQLIGVTHRDGHVLVLGWGAELPDWIIQEWPFYQCAVRLLSALLWPWPPFTCIQKQCSSAYIIPIHQKMSLSIPFRSYMCQWLAQDCAFDISVTRTLWNNIKTARGSTDTLLKITGEKINNPNPLIVWRCLVKGITTVIFREYNMPDR